MEKVFELSLELLQLNLSISPFFILPRYQPSLFNVIMYMLIQVPT